MANPSKAKGTRAEGEVLRWLTDLTGLPLFREPLHGRNDIGDIGGMHDDDGLPVVLEVKAGKPRFKLWLAQLEAEKRNAGADNAFIIWRTPGTIDPDKWIVITTSEHGGAHPGPGPATQLAPYVRAACNWRQRTFRYVGFRTDGTVPTSPDESDAVAMTGEAFAWWLLEHARPLTVAA